MSIDHEYLGLVSTLYSPTFVTNYIAKFVLHVRERRPQIRQPQQRKSSYCEQLMIWLFHKSWCKFTLLYPTHSYLHKLKLCKSVVMIALL